MSTNGEFEGISKQPPETRPVSLNGPNDPLQLCTRTGPQGTFDESIRADQVYTEGNKRVNNRSLTKRIRRNLLDVVGQLAADKQCRT